MTMQKVGQALANTTPNRYITKEDAEGLLQSFWPEAPIIEVKKAAIQCQLLQIAPHHVYIVGFKNKAGGKDWAIMRAIQADRARAQARNPYKYLDDTPRVMDDKDQQRRFGKVDLSNLWVIVKLRGKNGAESVGYGCWPKNSQPYGHEKGNSQVNMASNRAERQAISRLGGDMLPDNEIMGMTDARYMPEPSATFTVIEESTESKLTEVELTPPADEHTVSSPMAEALAEENLNPFIPWLKTCQVHNVAWIPDKWGKLYHPDNGGFCKFNDRMTECFLKLSHGAGIDKAATWIQATYGKTSLSPEQKVEACFTMQQLAEEYVHEVKSLIEQLGWNDTAINSALSGYHNCAEITDLSGTQREDFKKMLWDKVKEKGQAKLV